MEEALEGRAGGGDTPARHSFVDHTSELIVRIQAPTFSALLAEGVVALGELMTRSSQGTRDDTPRSLEIRARDEPALVVALLNELVYLGEAESWAPVEIEHIEVSPASDEVSVRARGVCLDEPSVLVKAATLHGLSIEKVGGSLEAEVTLDV